MHYIQKIPLYIRRMVIALFAGIILFVFYHECIRQGLRHTPADDDPLAITDTLRCTIYLPSHAGSRVSYHYELLKKFASVNGYVLQYEPVTDTAAIWEMVLTHQTDILAINIISDSIPKVASGKICITPKITDMGEAWITAKDRCPWEMNLQHWVQLFRISPQYTRFKARFLPASIKRSPYDSLLRVCGRSLGWDWKILQSVMYQESKYRMNAYSYRGAIGLMQMKASTARDMKVTNLFDPEENIRGACAYFAFLRKNMNLSEIPVDEQMHFILAAYNAGMGRVQEDRDKALADGKNPNRWEDVSFYEPEQTQQYIREIWDRYYQWTHPE